MSTIETGGPAFPMQEPQSIHAYAVATLGGITDPGERDRAYIKARGEAVCGATLRDYFAAKAMAGLMANTSFFEDVGGTDSVRTARLAYLTADAMLEARKEKP